MPFGDYENFDACVRDNQDKSDPEAYCAEIKRQIEGTTLTDDEQKALERSDCPEGQVHVGGACRPVDEVVDSVDAPPSILSQPRIMASASPLDTQPIEREELEDGKVAYRGLKLIDSGVWTDSGSETATLYDERTFENTAADYNTRKYDGPPVNIAHDLHKKGPQKGEPHDASIGGYIDPDSIQTDGEALFGDVILDRDTDAGAFADTNLKSALENKGSAGFSPSVELMPTELRDADHSHAEEYVAGAELTGLGLVRDPASRSVDLAQETQTRSVALSDATGDSPKAKLLTRQDGSMSAETREAIRAEILNRTLQVGDIQDDAENIADELGVPVADVMEVLDPLLDMDDEGGEGAEMEDDEDGDDEDDEDDEDETEMQEDDDDMDDMDAVMEQVNNLASRLEDLEDAMSQAMTADDAEKKMSKTLENHTVTLDGEKIQEAVKEHRKRLKELESEGKDAKTLTDQSDSVDYSDSDGGVNYDPATGSMSR